MIFKKMNAGTEKWLKECEFQKFCYLMSIKIQFCVTYLAVW